MRPLIFFLVAACILGWLIDSGYGLLAVLIIGLPFYAVMLWLSNR